MDVIVEDLSYPWDPNRVGDVIVMAEAAFWAWRSPRTS